LARDVFQDARPGLGSSSDASLGRGQYDFERLEAAVDFLIAEHERLTSEKSELLEELVERESRLASLESRLAHEKRKRQSALAGVDNVLDRLGQLRSATLGADSA
jgi:chromosome segregation ATPase